MFAALLRFAITVAAIPLCARFMDGVVVLDQQNALIVGGILAVVFTLWYMDWCRKGTKRPQVRNQS